MAETILVTGAAGFIAFHTIESFLKAGFNVIGIDNFDPFYNIEFKKQNIADLQKIAKSTKSNFEFYKHDICNLNTFKLTNKVSTVIHLAAKAGVRPSIENPMGYFQTNTDGTIQVLEFCKNNSIQNILFGSSSSVYGDNTTAPFKEDAICDKPISPYAASKRSCELLCYTYTSLYKMKIAALRFFTVYGPRQRPDLAIHKFSNLMLNNKPIPFFGTGETSRDYTHVSDIVGGITGAYQWVQKQSPGTFDIFNLGGNKTITLKQLVELLESSLNVKAKLDHKPKQSGDVERTCADISKSATQLGYLPKTSIQDGIKTFAEWILAHHEQTSAKRKAA